MGRQKNTHKNNYEEKQIQRSLIIFGELKVGVWTDMKGRQRKTEPCGFLYSRFIIRTN